MKMSIFDRLFSKETGGKREKPSLHASSMKIKSELDKSAAEVREQYPEDRKTVDDFVQAIKEARRVRRKKALEGTMEPMNAEPKFFLSRDHLAAYACLLPPENGGEALTLETFLEDMYYEGIVYGVLEETIPEQFSLGYYHIFPVARGTLPQTGEDGRVEEMFPRHSRVRMAVQNGSEVDFSEEGRFQPIRKGMVICRLYPPKPGVEGKDVTGAALPCPPVVSAHLSHGKNVTTDEDGQTLIAAADGILYIENDQFCIHAQKIIDGDLDQSQGTIQTAGDLYIGGNVDDGASVKATGDIIIDGKVGQARITSTEGTIHVRQGICGTDGKTFINAAAQVQAPSIERARIDAGTSVIAEIISNCSIQCGGTVYAMTGRGMIVTSQICAQDSIMCLRVGNVTGGKSQFSVGYPLGIQETWKLIKGELVETQKVMDSMWESALKLQRKGSRLTEDEKAFLGVLKEQREMYLARMDELKKELREVNQLLEKKSRGKIRCEKLHPVLEVQFGRLTEEITSVEEKCNIRVENNAILLR